MINITRLLDKQPQAAPALSAVHAASGRPRPVIVFNLTRRCNLACAHCYLEARGRAGSGELSLPEIKKTIDDLAEFAVPVLLLSGGEPLVHKHIFAVIAYAREKGLRVALSTNGTLITKQTAKKLRRANIDYAGVSIDGDKNTHDRFRKCRGAYLKAVRGIVNCLEEGIKTGVRFTICAVNAAQVPAALDFCEKEGVPRFCLYHLVYTGRGENCAAQDIDNAARRKLMDFLMRRALESKRSGRGPEILTVDNHADGIYLYLKNRRNRKTSGGILDLLEFHGGCSAGNKIAAISPEGEIYACQFCRRRALGNIRRRGFWDIWHASDDPWLCRLRNKAVHLKGKCAACRFRNYCGGCRVRAEAVYGDFWQEDPCCYLTEEEIRG